MNTKTVTIKQDRAEKIVRNRHPWIFSGAVKNADPDIHAGDIVSVKDERGKIFALGAHNHSSDIILRILSWSSAENIGHEWFLDKMSSTAALKERLLGIDGLPEDKKNYRVVYAESDGMPGLIIDRYGRVFVFQLQTLFADKNRTMWIEIVKKLWNPSAIYERSDVEVRKKEGLTDTPAGLLYGSLQDGYQIEEDGIKIKIDIPNGQKTGFFLDLRNARRRVRHWCGVLKTNYLQNYFGYTGSFGLYAAAAGVKKIEHIDVSEPANKIAEENFRINGFEKLDISIITSNAFDHMAQTKDGSVDAVVLDPPSFVKQRGKIANAEDGYRRLNALAVGKLKAGGLLFSFCCSSYIGEEEYRGILFKASASSGHRIRILEKIGHSADHTYMLDFPEGRYLQGWVLRKE